MCVNSPCIKPGIQIMMLHCLKYLKYTFVRVEVILYVDMLGNVAYMSRMYIKYKNGHFTFVPLHIMAEFTKGFTIMMSLINILCL